MPGISTHDEYVKRWFTFLTAFRDCCGDFNTSTPMNLPDFARQSPSKLVPEQWRGQFKFCVNQKTGLPVSDDAIIASPTMQALLERVYRRLSDFVDYVLQDVAGDPFTQMPLTDFNDVPTTTAFPGGKQQEAIDAISGDEPEEWFPQDQEPEFRKILADNSKKVIDAVSLVSQPPAKSKGAKAGGSK